MKIWYWHKENDTEPRGPVSEDKLKELAKNGDLGRDDKIWKEGFDDWTIATSVSGIFPMPPPIKPKAVKPPDITDGNKLLKAPNTPKKDRKVEKDINNTLKENSNNILKGVGGWLSFFCFAITILGPLIAVGQLHNSWEELSPLFDLIPMLESALWLETLTIIGIIIYSLFVGITIWSGHQYGKLVAEKYLKVRLIVFVALSLILLLMFSDDEFIRSIMIEDVLVVIFAELIFFGVWFSYFKKSIRVANTYPTE